MTDYVLGFLFDPSMTRVVLIQKLRPEWQAGRYNGVGGKVEPGETAAQAMQREFWEETGLTVIDWKQFATVGGEGFTLNVFSALSGDYNKVASTTDEQIHVCYMENVVNHRHPIIPNVLWMTQMAISMHYGERATSFTIAENYAS